MLCNIHHYTNDKVLDFTNENQQLFFYCSRNTNKTHALLIQSAVSVSMYSTMTHEINFSEFFAILLESLQYKCLIFKREYVRFIWVELDLRFKIIYFSICLKNNHYNIASDDLFKTIKCMHYMCY